MNAEQIRAEYIDHFGSDLMVVNAARTSFGKESEWVWDGIDRPLTDLPVGEVYNGAGHKQILKPEDANLIRYLATGYRTSEWDEFLFEIIETVISNAGSTAGVMAMKEELTALLHAYKRRAQHWAPFAHPHLSLRMNLPMFLARQFVKHQIGGTWSEESRRYISDEPGVWFPDEWHMRPEDVKQGSGSAHPHQQRVTDATRAITASSLHGYDDLLRAKVAPEEARIVLPLNTMTTVTWTGSLLFWSRVCNQRVDSHAQLAAQELGKKIADIVRPCYPVSWAALCGE